MASIVGKAIKGFGKALKYHKAQRTASKKVHKKSQDRKKRSDHE